MNFEIPNTVTYFVYDVTSYHSSQGKIHNFHKMDKENISPEDMVVEFYTQVVNYYKSLHAYLDLYFFLYIHFVKIIYEHWIMIILGNPLLLMLFFKFFQKNAFQVLAKKMDAYISTIIAMKRGMSGVTNALLLFCGTDWPGMDHFKSLLKVRNTTSQKFLILFICSFIICMSTICLSCYNTL